MVKSLLNVYANCVGDHKPEIGDASLIGSGDTGGDGDKSDVPTSVSGDTAGEGVRAPSSSKATGFFLCFVFFRFPFFFPVYWETVVSNTDIRKTYMSSTICSAEVYIYSLNARKSHTKNVH